MILNIHRSNSALFPHIPPGKLKTSRKKNKESLKTSKSKEKNSGSKERRRKSNSKEYEHKKKMVKNKTSS